MNKKKIFVAALLIAVLLPVCMSCSEHTDEETPMNETKKQTVRGPRARCMYYPPAGHLL